MRGGFNPNDFEVRGDYAIIFLTQRNGPVCEVALDAADLLGVIELGRWSLAKCGNKVYARCTVRRGGKPYKRVFMHRFIDGAEEGVDTDHWDGDGLNNRRHNLRRATKSKNQGNTFLPRNNRSGYKGVSWHKYTKSWRASIQEFGRQTSLGYSHDPEVAARAYDEAARSRWGEFARLNFPNPGERSARSPDGALIATGTDSRE